MIAYLREWRQFLTYIMLFTKLFIICEFKNVKKSSFKIIAMVWMCLNTCVELISFLRLLILQNQNVLRATEIGLDLILG